MAEARLFTSIPPRTSRTNAAGEEIGENYQRHCITSWIDAGFAPATINARSEEVDARSGLRAITVERDACEITGKPHPYFSDLLSAIANETDGPFALVNADIFVPPSTELAKRVASLRPGQVLIGRRLDVAEIGASGKPYFHGYDFFGAHSSDLAALSETHLVFGGPWWDHFFPLAMHLHGCQIAQIEPQVVHLQHHERWNLTSYTRLGERFISDIRPMIGNDEYARQLHRILATGAHARRAAARDLTLRWLRPLGPEEQRRLLLDRLGNLNLAVIDRLAPPPPFSGLRAPLRLRIQSRLLRLGAPNDIFAATTSDSAVP